MEEQEYWNRVFSTPDPWNYESEYEQRKYRHTLELIPEGTLAKAIELGCAEGIFTAMLAERVDHLAAVDLSDNALARATDRCAEHAHVTFAVHDIVDGIPGADFDLIVCSEILYYLRDRSAVERFASQAHDALTPGGHVLMAHANMVSDDRSETGFDFNEIGARTIGEVFSTHRGLEFERELRTELYRVQLFRRVEARTDSHDAPGRARGEPREVLVRRHADFELPSIKWGGCIVTAAEARHCWQSNLVPILMYHRIADEGPEGLEPYRVPSHKFERQLAWLQRHGYHGLTLDQYYRLRFEQNTRSISGKPVVLSFDDAYCDFYSSAWPLLRRYGFSATVFVPVDFVGRTAEWDRDFGPPATIMSWDQLAEVSAAGVQIGSHGFGHRRLWEMDKPAVLEDSVRSRQELSKRLGDEVSGYCYPYAAADRGSREMVEQAGYKYAVCGRGGNPPDWNDPFYIPRIEIFGDDSIDDFIAKLPTPQPASQEQIARYYELRARRDRATYMDR